MTTNPCRSLPRIACAVALLVAAVAPAGCAAFPKEQLTGGTGRGFAIPSPAAPMPRFAIVDGVLARGGQPDHKGFEWLRARGYRTVINLRQHHSDAEMIRGTGLRLVEIPTQADIFGSTAPTDEEVARFFATVLDTAAQPVYLHCAHGKDRTGTYAALYRMEVQGWSRDEAIEEMQAFGYNDFYKDLINFVRRYEVRGYAGRK